MRIQKAGAGRLALRKLEAAAALGLSDESFDRYVKPQVRVVRRGSLRLYPVAELERWLAESAELEDRMPRGRRPREGSESRSGSVLAVGGETPVKVAGPESVPWSLMRPCRCLRPLPWAPDAVCVKCGHLELALLVALREAA